jgi:hypothetical protein
MAITLDITGVLQAAAFWVSNKGGSNTRKLFFYFYVMLALLSVALGNDPVILSGTAFLVYYTKAAGLEPIAWLIAEFAAANTSSMVLFVGNPTNVVICEGFRVNNAAFTAYTIFPFLACTVACFIALAMQFRDKKYISRKFSVAAPLSVRAALRDPVGAWVGSLLLGTCLAVIIVVSFFKVDVWKVSVPFAVAKLAFDLGWDFYRYKTGRSTGSEAGQLSKDPMESELKRMSLPNEAASDSIKSALESSAINSSFPTTNSSPPSTLHSSPFDNSEKSSPPMTKPSPSSALHSSSSDNSANSSPSTTRPSPSSTSDASGSSDSRFSWMSKRQNFFKGFRSRFVAYFPTFSTAFPRLPFGLIPFAFSQFILIEALNRRGWIDVFAHWLKKATVVTFTLQYG